MFGLFILCAGALVAIVALSSSNSITGMPVFASHNATNATPVDHQSTFLDTPVCNVKFFACGMGVCFHLLACACCVVFVAVHHPKMR